MRMVPPPPAACCLRRRAAADGRELELRPPIVDPAPAPPDAQHAAAGHEVCEAQSADAQHIVRGAQLLEQVPLVVEVHQVVQQRPESIVWGCGGVVGDGVCAAEAIRINR
eukprot:COSAG01_NODE_1776_length_9261_cov_12.399694_8_plen_109_part_01